jgi:hypothetical protein
VISAEMKNKNHKMQVLRKDLIKYSKQIGILNCEIPKLVFYGEEFKVDSNAAEIRHGLKPSRRGGRHTTYYGLCSYYSRIIFVNIRTSRTLRELRMTLVHELVHYRFHYLSHGIKFEDRIKQILKGKGYSAKHITIPQLPYI